jgi:hypothetical protein
MSAANPARHAEAQAAEDFLGLLWPACDDESYGGHINIWTLENRQSQWFSLRDVSGVAKMATALANTKNVYFGTALIDLELRKRHQRIENNGVVDLKAIRGTSATASALFGLHADIDIGGPIHGGAHKNTKLPPTYEDARALIDEAIPLEPTVIIDSGHGFYPLWLFAEPWSLDGEQDREEAAELVYRFQATLQAKAKAHGWEIDGTADLARVLRLPGTMNRKLEPVPVKVIALNESRRYQTDSFDPYLLDVEYRHIVSDPVPLPEDLDAVELDSLPVAPWTKKLIRDGNEWVEDKQAWRYGSRSQAVWRAVNEMVEAGLPDASIAAVLLDARYKISENPLEKGRRARPFVAREIGKARKYQVTQSRGPTIDFEVGDLGERRNGHPEAGWQGATVRESPLPHDGAVLNDVHAFLGRFVAYPSDHAHVAHALWIAHAHLMNAWESTPRIAFLSPEPGSGKTRALEVSELLVPRPVEAVNVTPAYLFRKVGDAAGLPTILYDEIDTVFGPKARDNEEIRGLLNAGHRRGAVAGRCVVKGKLIETEEIPAYCAVALAGLGGLPDTILSRSVILRMRRRAPGEHVEPFRRRLHEAEGHAIRNRLKLWAASVEDAAADYWPEMPTGIVDRDSDIWEALLTVADLAGGEWPQRARCAAVTLVTDSKAGTPSLGVRLLVDLRTVFDGHDVLSSDAILSALNGLEEAPWGEIANGKPLNARSLSRRLNQYGVASKTVRIGATTAKGYAATDLADAWQRYVPSPPYESVTSVTNEPSPPGQDVTDGVPDNADPSVTDDDVEVCATCGVNAVGMVGLDCEECMGVAS